MAWESLDARAKGSLAFQLNGTNVYFGGKLVAKGVYASGNGYYDGVQLTAVTADRLGSIRKFYPYGQERPSATQNDTEKFTGYYRDSETGLDYANQRYEQPGMGRFMTPDPYVASVGPADPGSWNRYAYVEGDPINRIDSAGLDWCSVDTYSSDSDPADCGGSDPSYWEWLFQPPPPSYSAPEPTYATVPITFGDGDAGSLTLGINSQTAYLNFADAQAAEAALGICVLQPELCVVVGGVGVAITISIAWPQIGNVINAIANAVAQPKSWPACVPPVGTIGYRLDGPSSRQHAGMTSHVNLYRMNQNPKNGQCFWQSIGATPPPPPPGAVPIFPAAGGTNQ